MKKAKKLSAIWTSAIRKPFPAPSFASHLLRDPWSADELHGRLANGVFWSVAGSIIAQGASLLASVPVARLLGAKGYGELGIIQGTLMSFVLLWASSLGDTAAKYLSELRGSDPERAGRVAGLTFITGFVVSTLVGSVIYVLAPYLAEVVLSAPELSCSIRVAALVVVFKGFYAAQAGVLAGVEAFDAIAKINAWTGAVSLPVMILGAWSGGVQGAVLALAIISLITVVIAQRMVYPVLRRSGVHIRYRESMSVWRILPKFYFPTVLAGLVTVPVIWIANVLLVKQPNGYVEMGVFGVASQWVAAIQFLPSVMARPVLPILSNLYGREAMRDYERALRMNLVLAFWGAAVPGALVILASGWIMRAYGSGFAAGRSVLVTLALAMVLASVAAVLGTAISSIGKRWHATWLNCLWAVVFIVACFSLLKRGALGLAHAYVVSYGVHFVSSSTYAFFALRPRLRSAALRRAH